MRYLGFLLLSLWTGSHAAHSRRRVVSSSRRSTPVYDRSVTTWDPSGRLLQVEYGIEAADRGGTVCAVVVGKTVYVLVAGGMDKVHRLDEYLWMFTSGLIGDAQALASNMRVTCQKHRLSYGEPMMVSETALAIADLHHELTRTAGARPLGCTSLVLGVDRAVALYRTDPGGNLQEASYAAIGEGQLDVMRVLEESYEDLRALGDDTSSVWTKLLPLLQPVMQGELDGWMVQLLAYRACKTTCFRSISSEGGIAKVKDEYFSSSS